MAYTRVQYSYDNRSAIIGDLKVYQRDGQYWISRLIYSGDYRDLSKQRGFWCMVGAIEQASWLVANPTVLQVVL